MKQKMNKLRKMLLLPMLVIALLIPSQAFAAYSCTVSIPVEVQVTGSNVPSGNEYQIILEALDTANPMPAQNTVTITDSGKASIGPITFTKPDDYQYRIYQTADAKQYFTYDTTVYTVTVRVLNDDQTGGLRAEIWAIRDAETQKVYEITFENSYAVPYNPPAPENPAEPEFPEVVEEPAGVLGVILPPLSGVSGTNRVQTGDTSPVAILMMTVMTAMIVIAAVIRRRRMNDAEE